MADEQGYRLHDGQDHPPGEHQRRYRGRQPCQRGLAVLLQQGEGIATALLSAVGVDVAGFTVQVRGALAALPSASGSSVSAPQLSQASYKVINSVEVP